MRDEIQVTHSNSRLLLPGLVTLWFSCLWTACGPGEYAPNGQNAHPTIIEVTQRAEQNNFVLLDKQVAAIELPANLSTGYHWVLEDMDDGAMNVIGSKYRQENNGLLGAPGKQVFYLAGTTPGLQKVRLSYTSVTNRLDVIQTAEFSFQVEAAYEGGFQAPTEDDDQETQDQDVISDYNESSDLGLPGNFSWCEQGDCTPVRNQGSCGSCWAFATAVPMESALLIHNGENKDLSEQYLVSCNNEGWGCNGGWWGHDYHATEMVSGETEAGAVLEVNFPYEASDLACNPPHDKTNKLQSWEYVTDSSSVPSVDQLKQAIYEHGPLSVAVCVNSEFQNYTGGVFNGPGCTGVNHGVALVGWNDDDQAWIMKNSWGADWGENGYMRIGYNVSKIGYAAAYVTLADTHHPSAAFSYTGNDHSIQFTDLSQASSGQTITEWDWDFGDGSTSSEQNPTHTFNTDDTFSVSLTVVDSSEQQAEFDQEISIPFVPQYCSSKSNICNEEWISKVQIDSFSHESDSSNYSDFTQEQIQLDAGIHQVTIQPTFNGGPWTEYVNIWIDFNRDGDFEDEGEKVLSLSGSSTMSGTFTTDEDLEEETTRMRISMKYYTAPQPCGTFSYGEVEDYTVKIMNDSTTASLLINEVLADPPAGYDANNDGLANTTQDEFVELVNIGSTPLDLSGATLSDSISTRIVIPDGVILEPNQPLVIFGGGSPNLDGIYTLTASRLALNNSGDTISILAADGSLLASMTYGPEGGQDQSLVRKVDADASAEFVLHSSVSSSPASPGTRSDGSDFGPQPQEPKLLINEVLADPPADYDANNDGVADTTEDEFVELVNISSTQLDLSGASLSDAISERIVIPDGVILEPNQPLVIFGGGNPNLEGITTLTASRLNLNNTGDTITIIAADGTLLASMSYGPEGGQDQSLVREIDADATSEFVLHTTVASTPASPGTRSDGSDFIPQPQTPQLLINEVLADPPAGYDANNDGEANTRDDEFVELINAGPEALDLSGATLSDSISIRITIPDGLVLEPNQPLVIFGGGIPNLPGITTLSASRLSLNNSGDTITVLAADGTMLASMSYGPEGDQDQSLVREIDADASAEFVQHTSIASTPASPGTRSDGSAF